MLNFSEILLLVLIGAVIFKNFGLNLNLNDIKLISLSKNMDFLDTNNWSSITDWLTDLYWIEAGSYTFIFKDYDFF